jgi:hypothetical protein
MILIISILTVSVSALSFTTSMTASNQKVTAATEVVVTVKISNLDVGDNGLNSFTANLYYDSDVFESLTDSSVEGLNGWKAAYSSGTGKMTLQKSSFVKSDEEIVQISLKTKSGLSDNTQGEVKLSQIIASNSVDEISANSVSTTITISSASTNTIIEIPTNNTVNTVPTNNTVENNVINITPTNNTNTINTTNNTNETNNVNITNNANTNNAIVDNTVENDMPYTGSESSSLSKIIIGIILLAMVAYIKIERMKDIK